MDDPARILADQVRLDLLDGGLDRLRPPLDDRLTQPDDAGVGMHLQEQPPRLDEEGFQPGDPQRVLGGDRGLASGRGPGLLSRLGRGGHAQTSQGSGDDLATVDQASSNFGVFIMIHCSQSRCELNQARRIMTDYLGQVRASRIPK